MPNPKVAWILACLSGLLSSASFALIVLQVFGYVPIGPAMYTALGAVMATTIWLAMWTVDKVHEMNMQQTAVIAAWLVQARTDRVVSRPVPVLRVSDRGDGDTTLGLRRQGGTTTQERRKIRDEVYWQAYSDLAEDILCGHDATNDAEPDA